MVVWRNIHEKKIAWSSRHVWWFKVVGAVSTIVSAYENHMSHRFSSTNQLWQSLGWSVFISQRLGFPCCFFPIGCIGIMQRFWESCSWWRFHTMFSPPEPNWLKKIQVPETHPKRHRPRPCESALEMAELRPIATAFQQQRKNPSIPGKVSGIIIES